MVSLLSLYFYPAAGGLKKTNNKVWIRLIIQYRVVDLGVCFVFIFSHAPEDKKDKNKNIRSRVM